MSAIGNIFWRIFDGQSSGATHQESVALNREQAKANLRSAGAYLASPYTTIRDAYRSEPSKATGFKKIGLGVLTGLAFIPLAVRGLIGGAFYGLLALKNGAIDGAAHGAASLFAHNRTEPSPSQPTPPKPRPVPPSGGGSNPAPAKTGRVGTGEARPSGGVRTVHVHQPVVH